MLPKTIIWNRPFKFAPACFDAFDRCFRRASCAATAVSPSGPLRSVVCSGWHGVESVDIGEALERLVNNAEDANKASSQREEDYSVK